MRVENIIRIAVGFIILCSLSLGVEASPIFHHVYWLWLTAFMGLNLLQSGFTEVCPLEMALKKTGIGTK